MSRNLMNDWEKLETPKGKIGRIKKFPETEKERKEGYRKFINKKNKSKNKHNKNND